MSKMQLTAHTLMHMCLKNKRSASCIMPTSHINIIYPVSAAVHFKLFVRTNNIYCINKPLLSGFI